MAPRVSSAKVGGEPQAHGLFIQASGRLTFGLTGQDPAEADQPESITRVSRW